MSKLRIGIVHYINSRPLSRGLQRGEPGGSFVCELLPPAVIADRLRDGSLDVGLVPSVEVARIPGLAVVPGIAIAATHEVRSVLLVSKVPIGEIRSVALDENSRPRRRSSASCSPSATAWSRSTVPRAPTSRRCWPVPTPRC